MGIKQHNSVIELDKIEALQVESWLLRIPQLEPFGDPIKPYLYFKVSMDDVIKAVKTGNTKECPATIEVTVSEWDGLGIKSSATTAIVTINN